MKMPEHVGRGPRGWPTMVILLLGCGAVVALLKGTDRRRQRMPRPNLPPPDYARVDDGPGVAARLAAEKAVLLYRSANVSQSPPYQVDRSLVGADGDAWIRFRWSLGSEHVYVTCSCADYNGDKWVPVVLDNVFYPVGNQGKGSRVWQRKTFLRPDKVEEHWKIPGNCDEIRFRLEPGKGKSYGVTLEREGQAWSLTVMPGERVKKYPLKLKDMRYETVMSAIQAVLPQAVPSKK